MSKWKASDSVLTINQVMNDINTWLANEACDLDEENENNRDPFGQLLRGSYWKYWWLRGICSKSSRTIRTTKTAES